mgnify:CR=1 FL=1
MRKQWTSIPWITIPIITYGVRIPADEQPVLVRLHLRDAGEGDPSQRGAVEIPASITVKELADLVGVNPANASPADQDAMAQHLLATQGLGPWGGGCG